MSSANGYDAIVVGGGHNGLVNAAYLAKFGFPFVIAVRGRSAGEILDVFQSPEQPKQDFFAATASGGLWKTENAGTTWKPVFDGEGSYSIGVVTIDPTGVSTRRSAMASAARSRA